ELFHSYLSTQTPQTESPAIPEAGPPPAETPFPLPKDFYTSPFADRPSQLGDALLARAEAVALARLAALEETHAPLAIGIFGDWGAGKSSFMETVESIVDGLQGHQPYCDRIVQIRFNAWHYIETNLWASLVSHIFTELDGQLRAAMGETVDTLYVG